MVFLLEDLPHVSQTAYCTSVSCADAIFTTPEVIAKYNYESRKLCYYVFL